MARIVGRLKGRQVANAKPKRGKDWAVIPDGGNLYLQCTRGKEGHVSRSWLFKYEIAGRRHEIGLGPLHTIGLAEARDRARSLRQQLLDGVDPLAAKRNARQALLAERARTVTFRQVAEDYLKLHLDSFKNAKHRAQWRSTLETYVHPKIGHMTVADIGPADVLRVVEPIWIVKRETASRVRQRVERILDYATTRELRVGDNPAAHVAESLPKGANGKGHHAALPYVDLPSFMAELRERDSLSARALEFAILTAARTNETIGAAWDEFDLKAKVWAAPAERMKAGKEHRVPLCDRAVDILCGLERHGERVFALSNMAMLELLRGMRPDHTVHGFRSTFMDWAHERTAFPKVVIDMALAHTVGDKVEAAYRRGDLFEKRRRLMDEWARYCAKPAPAFSASSSTKIRSTNGAIVPIRKVGA
jgi:integrase